MQALQAKASSTKVALQATMALERMLAKEQSCSSATTSQIMQQNHGNSSCSSKSSRRETPYDLSMVFKAASFVEQPHQLDFPSIEWSFDEQGHHQYHQQLLPESKIDVFTFCSNKRRKPIHQDLLVHKTSGKKKVRHCCGKPSSLARSMSFARDLDRLPEGPLTTLVGTNKKSMLRKAPVKSSCSTLYRPPLHSTSLLQPCRILSTSWED